MIDQKVTENHQTSRAFFDPVESDQRPQFLIHSASYPTTVSHFSGCTLELAKRAIAVQGRAMHPLVRSEPEWYLVGK